MFKEWRKVYFPKYRTSMAINLNAKEMGKIKKALKRTPRFYKPTVNGSKVTITFKR